MCSHCVRREHEQLSDLSGSQTFAIEAEDRGLARSQTLRRVPRPPLRLRSAEPSGGSGCGGTRGLRSTASRALPSLAAAASRSARSPSDSRRLVRAPIVRVPIPTSRAVSQRTSTEWSPSDPSSESRPTAIIVSGRSAGIGSSARRLISAGRRPLAATRWSSASASSSRIVATSIGSAGTRASVTC